MPGLVLFDGIEVSAPEGSPMSGLVLFDGVAVSNTSSAPRVTLVVDPRYHIAAMPKTRKIAAQAEVRSIKG